MDTSLADPCFISARWTLLCGRSIPVKRPMDTSVADPVSLAPNGQFYVWLILFY